MSIWRKIRDAWLEEKAFERPLPAEESERRRQAAMSISDEDIACRIEQILTYYVGIDDPPALRTARIFHDLGVSGEEADRFYWEVRKEFGLNFREDVPPLDPGEGGFRRKRPTDDPSYLFVPVTPQDLVAVVRANSWAACDFASRKGVPAPPPPPRSWLERLLWS